MHVVRRGCCLLRPSSPVPVFSFVSTRFYCRWPAARSATCPPHTCSSRLCSHQSSPLAQLVSPLCPHSSWALWVVQGNRETSEKGIAFELCLKMKYPMDSAFSSSVSFVLLAPCHIIEVRLSIRTLKMHEYPELLWFYMQQEVSWG